MIFAKLDYLRATCIFRQNYAPYRMIFPVRKRIDRRWNPIYSIRSSKYVDKATTLYEVQNWPFFEACNKGKDRGYMSVNHALDRRLICWWQCQRSLNMPRGRILILRLPILGLAWKSRRNRRRSIIQAWSLILRQDLDWIKYSREQGLNPSFKPETARMRR